MLKHCFKSIVFLTVLLILASGTFLLHTKTKAATIDELKNNIATKTQAIKDLEKEIAGYKTELEKSATEGKTLENTISSLATTEKKLAADIALTEKKIEYTKLLIEQLNGDIYDTEKEIIKNKQSIGEIFRTLYLNEEKSPIEVMLGYNNISDFAKTIGNLSSVEDKIRERTVVAKTLKVSMETSRDEKERQRKNLNELSEELVDRKKVIAYSKAEKARLLKDTKQKESEYKKMLALTEARKIAFEKELLDFESALNFAIDPSKIPPARKGVLSWPVDNVKITQVFGDTEFSRNNFQVYKGKGHNGIDLGAPIGTSVRSALSGVVIDSGDTDIVCPKASHGKWILVEHSNGLSTTYSHLSVIKKTKGDRVETGDIIGYVGSTGYSTGPHLHFSVYISQGVKVMQVNSKVCRGVYVMPVADLRAYLNPLLYL